MKSKNNWLRQPAATLIILLVLSSAFVAGAGLLLKHTAGRSSPLVQDTLAIAVPFIFLRGEVATDEISPHKGMPFVEEETQEDNTPSETPTEPNQPEGPPAQETQNPLYHHVEEDYFDTALFIGDSRTEGLKLYGRLGAADYFSNVGMSVFSLFEKTCSDKNFAEQSLNSLLSSKQYKTIYLSLGINEVGYPHDSLEKKFAYAVEQIRSMQPQAKLILLGNLTVSRNKAQSNETLSLANMCALNELIASFADNDMILYLDPNPLFADEEGYLRSDLTGDGVHPYAKEYRNLAIWLKDYGIE